MVEDEGAHGGPGATRALVLGGGGVTGIAWELGLVAAWALGGVDVRSADLIVGTSAGSTVAAQLRSDVPLDALVAAQLEDPSQTKEMLVEFDLDAVIAIFQQMQDAGATPQERCARVGAMALEAETVPEAVRLEIIRSRLPSTSWPEAALVVTAVDAASGAFVTFDRASGVDLVDAVAASCAVPGVWPPVTIGARRYIDGGVRSPTNAHLAEGCQRVVLVSPLAPAMARQARGEADRLVAAGAEVLVVEADERSLAEMGANPLDPAMRAAAVAAGQRQGEATAGQVARLWGG
jgi:NTE family protein